MTRGNLPWAACTTRKHTLSLHHDLQETYLGRSVWGRNLPWAVLHDERELASAASMRLRRELTLSSHMAISRELTLSGLYKEGTYPEQPAWRGRRKESPATWPAPHRFSSPRPGGDGSPWRECCGRSGRAWRRSGRLPGCPAEGTRSGRGGAACASASHRWAYSLCRRRRARRCRCTRCPVWKTKEIFLLRDSATRWIFVFKVLKFEKVLFEWALMVFTIFSCLFVKEIQNEVSAYFQKITNFETPSSNPLHRACSGFLIAACAFKSCSETRPWFWKLFRKPAMNVKKVPI